MHGFLARNAANLIDNVQDPAPIVGIDGNGIRNQLQAVAFENALFFLEPKPVLWAVGIQQGNNMTVHAREEITHVLGCRWLGGQKDSLANKRHTTPFPHHSITQARLFFRNRNSEPRPEFPLAVDILNPALDGLEWVGALVDRCPHLVGGIELLALEREHLEGGVEGQHTVGPEFHDGADGCQRLSVVAHPRQHGSVQELQTSGQNRRPFFIDQPGFEGNHRGMKQRNHPRISFSSQPGESSFAGIGPEGKPRAYDAFG